MPPTRIFPETTCCQCTCPAFASTSLHSHINAQPNFLTPLPPCHQLGLVDKLGGLQDAIALAKERSGLPEDAQVIDYPPDKSPAVVRMLRSYMAASPGDEEKDQGGGKQAGVTAGYEGGVGAVRWAMEGAAALVRGGAQVTPLGHTATAATATTAAGLGPVAAAVVAGSGLAALAGGGAGLGGGGAGSGSLRRAVGAVEGVLSQAVLLDATVSVYSPEAQLLSDTL